VKGQSGTESSQLHEDWGRDAALWLGRKRGGYRLAELGQLAGGKDDAALGQERFRCDTGSEESDWNQHRSHPWSPSKTCALKK
jgi:hypothetical protein